MDRFETMDTLFTMCIGNEYTQTLKEKLLETLEVRVKSRRKKFEKHNGWRDPDLKNKPRKRSIPNPIKRFYYDVKVELPTFVEQFQRGVGPRTTNGIEEYNSSRLSNQSSSVFDFSKRVISSSLVQKKRKSWDPCRPLGGAVRCAFCDYPYDSAKRRQPPHPFTPTVVRHPVNVKGGSYLNAGPAETSAFLNLGQAKRKITRLRRKRSSTELYSGLVAMTPL